MILLDNFSTELTAEAVLRVKDVVPRPILEASGGIDLQSVREIAESGVDLISVGALTHSAPRLDLSMLIEPLSA